MKRFAFMRDKTADVSVECNIYLLLFFSRLWKKQIVPNSFIRTERLFRGFLRVLEARWTVGGPPREIFPSFFGWAVDRYLCRGNYQRLRWRYGDPTKDKNFGAWASSPQVSRRWVYEKGAAPILGERIHLRGDREHLEGVSVSNDAFQDAQKIETFIL